MAVNMVRSSGPHGAPYALFMAPIYRRLLFATLLATVPAMSAFAQEDDCQGPSEDCVAVGGWSFSISLGAGVRTNPVVNEPKIPLVIIPQFSYYGKRFF